MQFTFTINDAAVPGITAARAAYNAAFPQTIEQDGEQVANPALLDNDTAYISYVLTNAVDSWNRQYAIVVVPEVPPVVIDGVPQEVTMRQGQVYLARANLLDTVEAAVNASGREAQITWEKSIVIERSNPLIIAIGKNVLGWTDAQIDAMFVAASAL